MLKLEIGKDATAYDQLEPTRFIPKPYHEELRNCKNYFERIASDSQFDLLASGFHDSDTEFRGLLNFSTQACCAFNNFLRH